MRSYATASDQRLEGSTPARRWLPTAPLMLAHLVKAGGAATNTRKATSLTLMPGYAHADGIGPGAGRISSRRSGGQHR
jgi:hypothetical protein